jgi:hypothetical protein
MQVYKVLIAMHTFLYSPGFGLEFSPDLMLLFLSPAHDAAVAVVIIVSVTAIKIVYDFKFARFGYELVQMFNKNNVQIKIQTLTRQSRCFGKHPTLIPPELFKI